MIYLYRAPYKGCKSLIYNLFLCVFVKKCRFPPLLPTFFDTQREGDSENYSFVFFNTVTIISRFYFIYEPIYRVAFYPIQCFNTENQIAKEEPLSQNPFQYHQLQRDNFLHLLPV